MSRKAWDMADRDRIIAAIAAEIDPLIPRSDSERITATAIARLQFLHVNTIRKAIAVLRDNAREGSLPLLGLPDGYCYSLDPGLNALYHLLKKRAAITSTRRARRNMELYLDGIGADPDDKDDILDAFNYALRRLDRLGAGVDKVRVAPPPIRRPKRHVLTT